MAQGVSRAATADKQEESEAAYPAEVKDTIVPSGVFIAFGTGPVLEVDKTSGGGTETGYVQEDSAGTPGSEEDSSTLQA